MDPLIAFLKSYFADPIWLAGAALSLLFAVLVFVGLAASHRALLRFGREPQVKTLLTFDPGTRRAFKGVFFVLATFFAFVAAARPRYGKEKLLVPATKVDVILVLDYSKSMYARDVEPSRIARSKAEVSELIAALPGARFGAVAFAGEPMGFPVTNDGPAVAQFFRGLEPNDMPVGGTAIARALDLSKDLLRRDPKSKSHKRFVILITDGEDLEGSPRGAANSLAEDGVVVHVVQIGGRTPERIPEIGPDGEVAGYRKTEAGEFMTTELSARAEAQLESVAKIGEGRYVKSDRGRTGIEELTRSLAASLQTDEYVEHYEDVYADVSHWPLGLAILLLIIETFLFEGPRRRALLRVHPAALSPQKRGQRV